MTSREISGGAWRALMGKARAIVAGCAMLLVVSAAAGLVVAQRADVERGDPSDIHADGIGRGTRLFAPRGRADFEDSFSQSLQASGGGSVQVGSGVGTGAVRSLFDQGTITRTGVAGDRSSCTFAP